tara:strand:- start:3032 stop:4714 length:1683 start_codon:yes stop_codon:yes gene_type:complete
MAVVQISKIQVRRGQKLQGTGLPQLSSGELGWAIDTREMYIGNGAVAEGAPAVGNTKILTEYDDIFALADSYIYRSDDAYVVTGTNSSNSIKRSLQERLDDRVSVRSFGAKGDGFTDDTAALQRAIDQLFINDANKGSLQSRVTLFLEAGEYLIYDTIYIPPYATIVGEGSKKTVITQKVNKPAFITVNYSSTPGNPASDSTTDNVVGDFYQATNILMKGLTVETTAAGAGGPNLISADVGTPDTAKALILESCKDSVFEDIYFKGVWTTGTPLSTDNGVVINSLSGAVASKNNKFIKCTFEGFGAAVRSKWDISNNDFIECTYDKLGWGVVFGFGLTPGSEASGQSLGPKYNSIRYSTFNNIFREAIWVENGVYNSSEQNTFTQCGNNGQGDLDPLYSVIKFRVNKNKSVNDYFSRTYKLASGSGLGNVPYIPEVSGSGFFTLEYENAIRFGQITNVRLFRLPGVINQAYEVNYTLVSENYRVIRSGTMHIVVDAYGNNVEASDDYHYVGDETYINRYSFLPTLDLTLSTIDVKITSTMPIDDETEFKYTVTAKKTNVI